MKIAKKDENIKKRLWYFFIWIAEIFLFMVIFGISKVTLEISNL